MYFFVVVAFFFQPLFKPLLALVRSASAQVIVMRISVDVHIYFNTIHVACLSGLASMIRDMLQIYFFGARVVFHPLLLPFYFSSFENDEKPF